MTFLAPLFFALGLGVAAAAVALHFIVTRQPPSSPLPTARFVPEGSVRVTTVAKPTDLWLLALRALLAIVVGAAFARPVLVPDRQPVRRVVAADVSRAVGAIEAVRDSARAVLKDGDMLVVFDSTARIVRRAAADSAAALERSGRPGRISVALIAALRSAAQIRTAADSIELVIISPFRAAELDGATEDIRKLWPGRIRMVRVPPSADSIGQTGGFAVRAAPDDPVGIAASRMVPPGREAAVRIVRGTVTPDDSLWARSGRRTLVRWPAEEAPPRWTARGTPDTVGAVVAGQSALVVPLERRWRLDDAARPTRIAARWIDGEPAAVEYAVDDGCIRDVAVPVPARGDVMLRPSFARLLETLGAPCAVTPGGPGIPDEALEAFGGDGALAAAAMIAPPDTMITPLVPWLLALALVLALMELLVRRRRG